MGYWRDGKFVKSDRFDGRAAFDKAKTRQAVDHALLSVQEGTMTARQALRHLLPEFPLLRKEKRRAEKHHMLHPLIPYYVAEVLGRPKPEPQKEIIYSVDE